MLCDYRGLDPLFRIFEFGQNPQQEASLFSANIKRDSVYWQDTEARVFLDLTNTVTISAANSIVRVRVFSEEEFIPLLDDFVGVHKLGFNIEHIALEEAACAN